MNIFFIKCCVINGISKIGNIVLNPKKHTNNSTTPTKGLNSILCHISLCNLLKSVLFSNFKTHNISVVLKWTNFKASSFLPVTFQHLQQVPNPIFLIYHSISFPSTRFCPLTQIDPMTQFDPRCPHFDPLTRCCPCWQIGLWALRRLRRCFCPRQRSPHLRPYFLLEAQTRILTPLISELSRIFSEISSAIQISDN